MARTCPDSLRQSCVPRWRHTLWNARTAPWSSRITSTGDVVDGERQEVAGLRNLERESGEQPAAVPDRAHLRGVQRVGVVERARHAVAVAARGEERVEFGIGRSGGSGMELIATCVGFSQESRLRSGSYSGRVWRTRRIALAHHLDAVLGVHGFIGGDVRAAEMLRPTV